MSKTLASLMLCLFLFSCEHPAPHVKAGQEFIRKYSAYMRQSHEWSLVGYGGGFYENINELFFDFDSFENVNIDDARIMLVESLGQLQNLINSDQNLQPFLCEVPFPINRITLGIGFKSRNRWVSAPKIAIASIIEGKIGYTIYDDCKGKLKIIHRETYEEACEIVRQQQQGPHRH